MKPNMLHLAVLSAVLAVCACTAAAATAPPQLSMTRPMAAFADVERQLADAIASHNQAVTDSLLSQDFEFRPGAHPREPTARADWLGNSAMQGRGTDQISVRDLGDVAVASFVMTTQAGTPAYVVDVWKKQGSGWQLVSRYQAALPAADAPTEDMAPTGRG